MRNVLRASLLLLLMLLVACPRGTRKTLVPDVPKSGDAAARTRFQEARAKFLRDGTGGGEFKSIVEDYPEDPIVPWAQLYAGIAALKERKLDVAAKVLGEVLAANVPDGLTARAELFLGITRNYQGDAIGALALLKRGEKAIEGDAERTEYLAAVAYATAASDRPLASLHVFDLLYPRVSPTERALIVARVEEVVAAADPNTLKRMFDELDDRRGPSMAAVASKLAVLSEAAGRGDEAARLREAAAPARAAVGLPR
ncbi:MAG: hypothetical protein H0T89_10585, partial [Deltaproteobacteria bacterium]|nr:hypothetical protein [Deltaproteobacteria bacterium]